MDEAGAHRFRSRWRETLRGRSDRAPVYKDIGNGIAVGRHRVLPAAVLRRDRHAVRLPAARTRSSRCVGDIDARDPALLARHAAALPLPAHDRERPILPTAATVPGGRRFFTLAKPFAQLALRGDAGDGALGARRCPTLASTAAPTIRSAPAQRYLARRRAPRADLSPNRRAGAKRLQQLLRRQPARRPPPCDSFDGFGCRATQRFALGVAPLANGFALLERAGIRRFITETELYAAARAPRRPPTQEQASNVDSMVRDLSELKVGDPVVHAQPRHRPLHGPASPWTWAKAKPSSCTSNTPSESKLYVPVAQLHVISRYTGADRRRGAAARARLRPMGKGQAQGRRAGARHRRRAAQPVRAPRRARGPCVPLRAARLRELRRKLRLRGNARPGRRDPRRDPGHDAPAGRWTAWSAATSASARPKSRCAPRSSPSWAASRSRSSRPPRCSPSSTRRPSPTASPTGRCKIAELSRFRSTKEVNDGDRGHRRRHRRHRRSARTSCFRPTCKFKRLGLRDHRRGAPLRRAPEGSDQGVARRGRRADADRHADPAHARHGARRPARLLGDRHRAAEAPRDQDLRAQRGQTA